ncbi:MAG: hypothetical protein ACOX7J_08235 [Bacillota bacterium]
MFSSSCFPCYNSNKAIYRLWANSKVELTDIIEISGGEAFNIVLGQATARVRYSPGLLAEIENYGDERISIKVENDEIHITATGIPRHAANPQGSVNATGLICSLLAKCINISEKDRAQMEFVSKILNDYSGGCFGIQNTDDLFGDLTCINGIVNTQERKLNLSFDLRFGASVDVSEMEKRMAEVLSENGFSNKKVAYSPAFYLPEKDPLVQKTLEVYREFTGNEAAKSSINAGGTYARFLPYAVEIGTQLWHKPPFDLPAGHGEVHQPDEYISIEGLMEAIELTVQIIISIDRIGE